MRRRREAKTPRRPRVITPRLVIVSVVFGAVLAVASVPLCDVAFDRQSSYWSDAASVWRFHADGSTAYVFSETSVFGRKWWVTSGGDEGTLMHLVPHMVDRAVPIDVDPRPQRLRWPLAVGEREARYTRVGWPLRSASRGRIWADTAIDRDEWGVSKAKVLGYEVSLSTRPIWPGLLGNALLFALLASTPIALWRWRKLRRRARRGLCVACAYELGECVGVCPECGVPRVVA